MALPIALSIGNREHDEARLRLAEFDGVAEETELRAALVKSAARVFDGVQKSQDVGEPVTPVYLLHRADASKRLRDAERAVARANRDRAAERAALLAHANRMNVSTGMIRVDLPDDGKPAGDLAMMIVTRELAEAKQAVADFDRDATLPTTRPAK